jgi:glucose/galactose transporter
MGVCNKAAGAIAPLLLIGAIVKNPNEIDEVHKQLTIVSAAEQNVILNELSSRLIFPYAIISIVLIGLGLVIKLTKLPDIDDENTNQSTSSQPTKKENLFKHTHLVLGAIAIFCGVGVEVLAVDTIINYAQYTGLSFREAKYFATYTLLIMIISYCIGIFTIPKIITQRKALMTSAILGIVLTILTVLVKGPISVWFIALLGLGNALLWPAIWPLSLEGLGKATSKGSALLIMGVVGGAVTPLLYGAITDASNPQLAYWILIPFYLFILYFSTSGYRAGKTKLQTQ